jgi:hypothetical protein
MHLITSVSEEGGGGETAVSEGLSLMSYTLRHLKTSLFVFILSLARGKGGHRFFFDLFFFYVFAGWSFQREQCRNRKNG